MEKSILFAALAFSAAPALAATDLSRPGALERLKSERPAHYDAVIEVAKVGERLSCPQQDLEPLRVNHSLDRLDCGFVIMTSNPPQRKLTFAIQGEPYVMAVRLRDTAPRLIGSRGF